MYLCRSYSNPDIQEFQKTQDPKLVPQTMTHGRQHQCLQRGCKGRLLSGGETITLQPQACRFGLGVRRLRAERSVPIQLYLCTVKLPAASCTIFLFSSQALAAIARRHTSSVLKKWLAEAPGAIAFVLPDSLLLPTRQELYRPGTRAILLTLLQAASTCSDDAFGCLFRLRLGDSLLQTWRPTVQGQLQPK